jgi:hypothetical protein
MIGLRAPEEQLSNQALPGFMKFEYMEVKSTSNHHGSTGKSLLGMRWIGYVEQTGSYRSKVRSTSSSDRGILPR